MKAMILAAGLGTRLKPWTNNHPKALALVNGKSLLQRNIEYLQSFGITDIIINVHHFAHQIIEAVKNNNGWGSNITISDETDTVLETGGGLKRAAWYFENEENFILMNVDVLTDMQLAEIVAFHKASHALATLATTNRKTSRYFLFNKEDVLCGWKNVNTNEEKIMQNALNLFPKAFSGIHIINHEIFYLIKNAGQKFSMVEVYLSLCNNFKILSFDHSETKFIDVGKPESIQIANGLFK